MVGTSPAESAIPRRPERRVMGAVEEAAAIVGRGGGGRLGVGGGSLAGDPEPHAVVEYNLEGRRFFESRHSAADDCPEPDMDQECGSPADGSRQECGEPRDGAGWRSTGRVAVRPAWGWRSE